MFGFLKKKLKESIDKITSIVKKEAEEEKEEVFEQKPIEELKEEIQKEKVVEEREVEPEKPTELEKVIELEKPTEISEEKLEKEKPKEIPSKQPAKKEEEIKPEQKAEQKKEGLLKKIKKAITEKEIKEEDIKDILWDLQISLIQSDVAVEVAEKICDDIKKALVGKKIKKRADIEKIIKDTLKKSIYDILSVDQFDIFEKIRSKKPFLIIFLGFNGSGKTTSIARMGYLLKNSGFSVVFAAADSWRAAAIEQLEEHGKNLGIKVIKHDYGADPAAVIFDARKYAEAHGIDVILADTAGRSHANVNLMDELKKIVRVNKPDMKILVIDALTGNDVVEQAEYFDNAVGVDAMILTKVDVYDKGGAILSAVHKINKPILYIGVGQEYQDLKKFNVDEIVKNLLE